jgi:hypothetical protein
MEVLRVVRPRRAMSRRRLVAVMVAAAALMAARALALAAQQGAPAPWPLKVREHVDLWLHGFAILASDSSPVPLYRKGYRESLTAARSAERTVNELDANADLLRSALAAHPTLLAAQFIALEYGTWADLDATLDAFVRTEGGGRGVPPAMQQRLARLAAVFRTREERDFARRYALGLRSERDRFHHQWWLAETRRRDAALARADSLWQARYLPALRRFLTHTRQGDGEIVLSTVLEAEGRTIVTAPARTVIAVGFPDRPERAEDAIYCVLHELVAPLAAAAVEDNVTPAEKRSGVADRHQSMALVRGGALLAARLGADVADGYVRFYLRAAGVDAGADVAAAFARAFPLPEPMLLSIERQVAVAFSGI